MIQVEPYPPRTIGLLTTFRCNASCANCCYGCRPDFGRTMTLDEMKHYVDVSLEAYPESINRLSLTGGECFLLGEDLERIVEYGASKGLSVDFMSNGFWGKNYAQAFRRIIHLKELGLKAMGFTVGEDHQHILSLKACRNAAVACANAGFKVEFRIEQPKYGGSTIYEELKKDKTFMRLANAGKIDIALWKWNDYNNEEAHRRMAGRHYRPYMKSIPCDSLFRYIEITPYGDVMACCGIGMCRNPYMRLGNIWKEPVKTLYERAHQDLLKVWIQYFGATDVLQYVHDNSDIKFHKWGFGCESCIEIFENPRILPFLRETYDDWTKKLL